MERAVCEEIIDEAINMIPGHIRARLENVAFIIDETQHGNLLGLYHGIPLPQRGGNYSGVLPDTITIFLRALEDAASNSESRLRRMIIETVHHEIAHYFGFSEAKVRQWERRRTVHI